MPTTYHPPPPPPWLVVVSVVVHSVVAGPRVPFPLRCPLLCFASAFLWV